MINESENINDDNYNSLKNVILIMSIIIFAYFIERTFPKSFLNNFYLFIVLIIIIFFILKILFNNF